MWIETTSGESAETLETRLDNLGSKVEISKHVSTSLAYSSNGVTLRQKETESVSEFRGLTKDAAYLLETLTDDDTESTTYYRTVGTYTATASILAGTKKSYVASRANEADGWRVTKTETVYAPETPPTDAGWSASGVTLSAEGVTVPVSSDKTSSYQFGTGSSAIYSIVTTTVEEIRFLTAAGKNAYMATATPNDSNSGSRLREHDYCCNTGASSSPYMVSAWATFNDGTDVHVSARYVSAEEGYTVTKTTTVYSFYPTGGRAPSADGSTGTVGWYLV